MEGWGRRYLTIFGNWTFGRIIGKNKKYQRRYFPLADMGIR